MNKWLAGISLCFILCASLYAETCLLLPLHSSLTDANDNLTIQELFKEAFSQAFSGTVVDFSGTTDCKDDVCARQLGKARNTDKVVYVILRKLGNKLIFTGTMLGVGTDYRHSVQATAMSIEDMEAVTRRVGEALALGQNLEEAVTTENITAREEKEEPTRRMSLLLTGISIGYLFPFTKGYAGLDIDSDVGDYDTTGHWVDRPETTDLFYSQIIKINWKNWYEFRTNMAISGDIYALLPVAVGGNFNYYYLFSKKDFTPFVTGGIGLEYVYNDKFTGIYDAPKTDTKRYSGPALNVGVGYLGFRTYDIHLFGQVTYNIVFNSDLDNGLGAELGIVYRPKKKESAEDISWTKACLLYLVIGSLVSTIIGSSI